MINLGCVLCFNNLFNVNSPYTATSNQTAGREGGVEGGGSKRGRQRERERERKYWKVAAGKHVSMATGRSEYNCG